MSHQSDNCPAIQVQTVRGSNAVYYSCPSMTGLACTAAGELFDNVKQEKNHTLGLLPAGGVETAARGRIQRHHRERPTSRLCRGKMKASSVTNKTLIFISRRMKAASALLILSVASSDGQCEYTQPFYN